MGKPMNGDFSFEEFLKKGRKETRAEAVAEESTRNVQEDPFFYNSVWPRRAGEDSQLQRQRWRAPRSWQEAGGGQRTLRGMCGVLLWGSYV